MTREGIRAVTVHSMARPLTPDYIQKIAPYVPGKPVKEVEREYGVAGALKLASNENCLGTSPRAIEAIRAMAAEAFLYPESTCPYVRPKLAAKLGVKPEQLVFGDGSHELLDLAVLAFVEPHQEVLTTDMTFAIYKLAAMSAGRAFREVPVRDMHYDLDALASGIRPETKLIFIANPNNPTGTIFRRAEFEKFLARVPEDVVLVMDEAYIEFCSDPEFPDSLRYHDGSRRIFTTRTFSKIYGLAGLRIGYGIASAEMIAALEKVRPSFNVNSIAQAAAAAALDDDDFVVRSREVAQAGIAAGPFAGFFEKINKEGEKDKAKGLSLPDVFSTHPPPPERAKRAKAQPAYPSTPALSPAEWEALRNICG